MDILQHITEEKCDFHLRPPLTRQTWAVNGLICVVWRLLGSANDKQLVSHEGEAVFKVNKTAKWPEDKPGSKHGSSLEMTEPHFQIVSLSLTSKRNHRAGHSCSANIQINHLDFHSNCTSCVTSSSERTVWVWVAAEHSHMAWLWAESKSGCKSANLCYCSKLYQNHVCQTQHWSLIDRWNVKTNQVVRFDFTVHTGAITRLRLQQSDNRTCGQRGLTAVHKQQHAKNTRTPRVRRHTQSAC